MTKKIISILCLIAIFNTADAQSQSPGKSAQTQDTTKSLDGGGHGIGAIPAKVNFNLDAGKTREPAI